MRECKSDVIFYLNGCETVLKVAPPAAARYPLLMVAAKLETTAQCETVPVPPLPDCQK